MTLQKDKLMLAKYAGVISRWCDLTGNVPNASGDIVKVDEELSRFIAYVESLAHSKQQQLPQWSFP